MAQTRPKAFVVYAFLMWCVATRLKIANGKACLNFPPWSYHILGTNPFNLLCSYTSSASDYVFLTTSGKYDDPVQTPLSSTPEQIAAIKKRVLAIQSLANNDTIPEDDLMRLFDACEPADAEKDLCGRGFRGKIIRTDRFNVLTFGDKFIVTPLNYVLCMNWNKRFDSRYVGDDMVFSWASTFYLPLPFVGLMELHNATYRKQTTATMFYSTTNLRDIFVKLEDKPETTVLLGLVVHADRTIGYFTLTWDKKMIWQMQ